MVGTMSIVSAMRSSVWSTTARRRGGFTTSGTGIRPGRLSSAGRRRWVPGRERGPVVGGEHHEGVVVEALGLEAVDQLAQQLVGELGLQEVALQSEVRRRRCPDQTLSSRPGLPGSGYADPSA